jgi:transmembrane sensor
MESHRRESAADEAGLWDARLRAPDCTDADRARFARWRDADPEHRLAFEKIQTIVATFRCHSGRADIRALRDAALRAQQQRHSRGRLLSVAAGVALLVLGSVLWATLRDATQPTPLEQLATLTEALFGHDRGGRYETGIAQRSTITLPDGSSVELNAKTRIKVAFTATTRTVELLHGQALFHVAKNPQRPFIVRAADRDIVAVGTAFDVRLDPSAMRVTLLEGKVRVTQDAYLERGDYRGASSLDTRTGAPGQGGEGQALSKPNDVYLQPGQQLVAPVFGARSRERARLAVSDAAAHGARFSQESAVVRAIDVSKVVGWRDGRVFLEDVTLAEAVAEMNNYSERQIRIADPQIGALRVNGMFRAGEQDGFVTALEQYFPVLAQHGRDSEITLTRRE